jgi:hypothetical protein
MTEQEITIQRQKELIEKLFALLPDGHAEAFHLCKEYLV